MFKYVKSNTNILFRKPQEILINLFVNNSGMLFNTCKFNFTQRNYFSEKNFKEYQKVDNILDKNFTNSASTDSELHVHRHATKPTLSHLKSNKNEEVNKEIKKDIYREIPEHKNIKIEDIENYYKEHSINIKFDHMEKIPPPILNFDQLNFTKEINEMIKSRFSSPFPIQAVGWPIALKGFNMVGLAETGSGKTLSYILPALMHIREQKHSHKSGPLVLIVAPTRELANQIHSVVEEYSTKFGIRSTCLYGGVSKRDQINKLSRGVDIVVATPGRLLDIINMGKTNLHMSLWYLSMLTTNSIRQTKIQDSN